MFNTPYFYNGSIKKVIAIFGSLFNDISIAKVVAGKSEGISRVPLMYGPRQRFLERLPTNEPNKITHVALRMPRMSFEITSIGFDPTAKLNRLNTNIWPVVGTSTTSFDKIYQAVPYKIGLQLSIISHHQDDALQIFEQIIPYFNPEYTVTVKDMEFPGSLTDLPIVLTGTAFQDDYDGDFESGRRVIIYTLDFDMRLRFTGIPTTSPIIKYVETHSYDTPKEEGLHPIDGVKVELGDPDNDTPADFTVVTTYGFLA